MLRLLTGTRLSSTCTESCKISHMRFCEKRLSLPVKPKSAHIVPEHPGFFSPLGSVLSTCHPNASLLESKSVPDANLFPLWRFLINQQSASPLIRTEVLSFPAGWKGKKEGIFMTIQWADMQKSEDGQLESNSLNESRCKTPAPQ